MRFPFTRVYLSVISLPVNIKITVWVIFLYRRETTMLQAAMITPAQIRAARAILGWKQTDLCRLSGVSEMSIKNIERGITDARASTLSSIQQAFLDAGVVFLDDGDTRDGGPGVRFIRKPSQQP